MDQRARSRRSTRIALTLLLALASVAALPSVASAGMTVQPASAEALAVQIAGPGIQVTNVSYTGAAAATGAADGAQPIVGFGSGAVLSTGNATVFQGPNSSTGASGHNDQPGTDDLTALAGAPTYDAAVLEFDFVPRRDQISLDFVFGSEEYNEFVGSYNDVFAFYVNGRNCAVAPDGAPVTVDTINAGRNTAAFRDNEAGAIDVELDGLTTTLRCTAPVAAGEVNRMRLAIADTGDSALDAAVLIATDSLTSTACSDDADNDGDGTTDLADPGCDGPADDDETDLPRETRASVTLRVLLTGPGGVDVGNSFCGSSMTASGPGQTVCEYRVLKDSTFVLTARPQGGVKSFLSFGGLCLKTGPVTCSVVMNEDREVSASFDPVRAFAPNVYFSGPNADGDDQEKYFPGDPGDFVRDSRLMWRNVNIPPPCQRDERKARTEVDDNPNAAKLREGAWSYRFCYRVSRGKAARKRFSTKVLTAPAETKSPKDRVLGRSGFYLDVKNDRVAGRQPRNAAYTNAPPMYYEYVKGRFIVYWFFYPGNNRLADTHEGDWERIVVDLNGNDLATQVAFYTHYCPPAVFSWQQLSGQVERETHPTVWVATGGHGTFPNAGTTNRPCGDPRNGVYDRRFVGGQQWQTWTTGLRDAAKQSWYGLGVGWGREGGVGWGPVGPGKFKKNVVPNGW